MKKSSIIILILTVLSYTACTKDNDNDAQSNKSNDIVEMLTGKWTIHGVYKKTEIDGRVKSYNYTGEIEFMHDKSIYMDGSPFRYDIIYENGIPKTSPTSIANVINYYWGYSVVDIGGKDYISIGNDEFRNNFQIVSLTKNAFILVEDEDKEYNIDGKIYKEHYYVTMESE